MFDTIILLSGAAELATLPLVLLGHRPDLSVIPVQTPDQLATLNSEVLRRARLIAFVTSVIVPENILTQLGYGAFNFHPGPPSYPGWAPAHFALYNRATEFGATAHAMIEQVDAGPIVGVALFPIPAEITVFGLEGLAYAHLAQLFWRMARSLATDASAPPALPHKWGAKNIPAVPIARSATFRSTFPGMNWNAASRCSAAIISGCRRPSICMASSFAR